MTRGVRVLSIRLGRILPRAAVLAVGLALVVVGASGRAEAQMTQAQKDEVKLHYQRATRAYDLQKYTEAIEEYQKAYEISGDPPMLYNIAQAYRLADQPGEAVRYYRRFLQRMPNARNREDVERKIADQEKIAEGRRKASEAAPPPPTLPTKPPPVVEVKPPPPPVVPAQPPPAQPAPAPEPSHARAIIGWCLVGAGVIAGGLAGYEGYVATQKADQLSKDSMMMMTKTFDPSLEDAGKNANIAAIALGIGGAALGLTGIIVLLTGSSPSEQTEKPATPVARLSLTPWVSSGLVGGGARLQF
jgi:tetratricopeptide (TPR) repeat protein